MCSRTTLTPAPNPVLRPNCVQSTIQRCSSNEFLALIYTKHETTFLASINCLTFLIHFHFNQIMSISKAKERVQDVSVLSVHPHPTQYIAILCALPQRGICFSADSPDKTLLPPLLDLKLCVISTLSLVFTWFLWLLSYSKNNKLKNFILWKNPTSNNKKSN